MLLVRVLRTGWVVPAIVAYSRGARRRGCPLLPGGLLDGLCLLVDRDDSLGVPRQGRLAVVGHLEHYLVGDLDPDVMWTEEGNVRAVSRYLLCNICTVAPDAIFVDAAMVGDLELLREELATQLPRELIPELLMPPADFNELMLAGELALCAQRMAKGRRP